MNAADSPYPIALELTSSSLRIVWSDGRDDAIPLRQLRQACPCAHCRQPAKPAATPPPLLPVLTPQQTRPLTIESMQPVGQYAYGISFSDGHNGGIFTFELLRMLGEAQG